MVSAGVLLARLALAEVRRVIYLCTYGQGKCNSQCLQFARNIAHESILPHSHRSQRLHLFYDRGKCPIYFSWYFPLSALVTIASSGRGLLSALVTSGAGCVLIPKDGFYKAVEIVDCQDIKPQRVAVVDVFGVVHRPAEQDASPVGEAPELVGIVKLLAQLLCLRYAAPEPAIAALDLVQDGGQCTGLGILPKAKAIFAGCFHDALFSGGGDVLHFCCLPACGLSRLVTAAARPVRVALCLAVIVLYYIDLVLSSLFIIFFMIFWKGRDGALYQEFLHGIRRTPEGDMRPFYCMGLGIQAQRNTKR